MRSRLCPGFMEAGFPPGSEDCRLDGGFQKGGALAIQWRRLEHFIKA